MNLRNAFYFLTSKFNASKLVLLFRIRFQHCIIVTYYFHLVSSVVQGRKPKGGQFWLQLPGKPKTKSPSQHYDIMTRRKNNDNRPYAYLMEDTFVSESQHFFHVLFDCHGEQGQRRWRRLWPCQVSALGLITRLLNWPAQQTRQYTQIEL